MNCCLCGDCCKLLVELLDGADEEDVYVITFNLVYHCWYIMVYGG